MNVKVLIVDGDDADRESVAAGLRRQKCVVKAAPGVSEALFILRDEEFDTVAVESSLRGSNGEDLCRELADNRPDVPVVVMASEGNLQAAIDAVRYGAYDFITKPVDPQTLAMALERATSHRRLREEVRRLRKEQNSEPAFSDMVGSSPAMLALYDLLGRVAPSQSSVMVTGESGTGKELVARAIHEASPRKDRPFVAINCAAMPAGILESELFGHVRGAFTDARVNKVGLLKGADGGSIFLDEIGEMPMELQPKLLRALQERRVRPVGGESEVSFDARIVTATNRDLERAVEERRFREDLLFRINVITISLPPLRARGNDILLLAQAFVTHFATVAHRDVRGLSLAAAEKCLNYSWPGNVRELRNCIERAVALTRFEQIAVEDLPEKIRNYRPSYILVAGENPLELVSMEEMEKRYIMRVLKAVGGSRTDAARILGFDRKTLYRKLDRYGVATAGRDKKEKEGSP